VVVVACSPSGCTFWGKKPWSRKKKILWQLGTLIGAPVGISLIAAIAVPAIIIGVPIWVGRKVSCFFPSFPFVQYSNNFCKSCGICFYFTEVLLIGSKLLWH